MLAFTINDVDLMVVFVDDTGQDKHENFTRRCIRPTGSNFVLVWQDQYGRTRFIALSRSSILSFEVAGYDQLRAQLETWTSKRSTIHLRTSQAEKFRVESV